MKRKRNTKQKEFLIQYLQKHSNTHLSIKEIQEELKDKIGTTTIYRIINDLIETGIVTKIPLEYKQGYCYRYNFKRQNCNEHYHLICEKCNKLLHFESKKINNLANEINKTEDFQINNDRIVFYGVCKECKDK